MTNVSVKEEGGFDKFSATGKAFLESIFLLLLLPLQLLKSCAAGYNKTKKSRLFMTELFFIVLY
jgi:hypothetical protein